MPFDYKRSLVQRMGGRKWLASIALTALATWLALQKVISGDAWVTFETFLYGILVGGNIGERAVNAAREVRMPATEAPK